MKKMIAYKPSTKIKTIQRKLPKSLRVAFLSEDNIEIHGNRAILSATSEYFRNLLTRNFQEKQQLEASADNKIPIKCPAHILRLLITYLQGEKIELTSHNILPLYYYSVLHLEEGLSKEIEQTLYSMLLEEQVTVCEALKTLLSFPPKAQWLQNEKFLHLIIFYVRHNFKKLEFEPVFQAVIEEEPELTQHIFRPILPFVYGRYWKRDQLEQYSGQALKELEDDGVPFVHYVAAFEQTEALQWLIDEKGFSAEDFKKKDAKGSTILNYAANSGHLKTVKMLIKICKFNHQDILSRDNRDKSVLDDAAQCGNPDVFLWFFDENIIDKSQLSKADWQHIIAAGAISANPSFLSMLLDHGFITRDDLRSINFDGCDLLVYATDGGNPELFDWLLSEPDPIFLPQDLSKEYPGQKTLLHHTARAGAHKLAQWFLKKGYFSKADLCQRCDQGDTLFHLAARNNKKQFILWLLKIDPTLGFPLPNFLGQTIFHLLCEKSHPEFVQYLVEKGHLSYFFDFKETDHSGQNGLDYALIGQNQSMFDWLRNINNLFSKEEIQQSISSRQPQS